jgi:hypothetical protein
MFSRAGGPSNNQGRGTVNQAKAFRAPVRGLVLNENLAGAKGQAAIVLENWTPISRGARMRRGSRLNATVGTHPVESMMSYYAGAVKKKFAVSDGSIFDISSVDDATVAPDADVTGLNASYFSYVNFTTSGGPFMPCVNGVDNLQMYDGDAWSVITDVSVPAITGVGTDTFSHVWVYRNRLFFVQKNSQTAWYLPVDSIGGAAGSVSLSGIFQKGGHLMFGATWSLDSGDGIDDKCVFVSDLGEIVVFEGSNPAGATEADWNLVGRYDGAPPMGPRATMGAGGDLLIAGNSGLVAVSASITKDPGAIGLSAVSRDIEPLWTDVAVDRDGLPWEIAKWPDRQIAIVATPVTSVGQRDQCFVVNLETGAWSVYTGWNTRSLVLHDKIVYFGTNDGRILEAEIGGNDDGLPYFCNFAGAWDHCGSEGIWKEFVSARAVFRAGRPFNARVSVSTDYTQEFGTAPDAADGVTSSLWDEGNWDEALWDSGGAGLVVNMEWDSLQASGTVVSPQVQITSGSASAPDCEMVSFHLVFKEGAFLT